MTREELLQKLRNIHLDDEGNLTGDEEKQHIRADNLLLEYINDAEITNAFESIDKWYA